MSLRPSMIRKKLQQQKQHRFQQVSICGVARTLGEGLWHQWPIIVSLADAGFHEMAPRPDGSQVTRRGKTLNGPTPTICGFLRGCSASVVAVLRRLTWA